MDNVSAIILAAGNGSRMKSDKAKTVHKLCGTPMISRVYGEAEKMNLSEIITVVGYKREQVTLCLGEDKVYSVQEQQLGTGNAVSVALEKISGGTVLILCGDTPLITAETLTRAVEFHLGSRNAATVITATVGFPGRQSRVIRDEKGDFAGISSARNLQNGQEKIHEIHSGMYCFDCALLKAVLSGVKNDDSCGEYHLTDTLDLLLENGYSVGAFEVSDPTEVFSINNMADLAAAEKFMRRRINTQHMLSGVRISDPENTYIEDGVTIGADTEILPGCIIGRGCVIGKECIIGPNSNLSACTVGDGSKINSSTVTESEIGKNVNMGPYAYVRPGSKIMDNVKVGDFVEVKNSTVGVGTKIAHLTYVGDSDVGGGVNFGCGTVTVNYDSKKKHRTVIGDGAFIGCNTNLVAPVTIGEGAYTAAGSTITEDVPGDALAIARSRQSVKENWRIKKYGK